MIDAKQNFNKKEFFKTFNRNSKYISLDLETLNGKKPDVYLWGITLRYKNYLKFFSEKVRNNFTSNQRIHQKRKYKIFNKELSHLSGIDFKDIIQIFLHINKIDNVHIITQNGSKFDLRFVLYKILSHPYFINNVNFVNDEKELQRTLTKNPNKKRILEEFNEFDKKYTLNYLIDKNFKIYFIDIKNNETKKHLYFFDMNMQFSGSLALKGDAINLPKLDNENNYNKKELYKNISDALNDKNEIEYLQRDCDITYLFATMMYRNIIKEYGTDSLQLTAGSIAFNTWKQIFGDKIIKRLQNKNILGGSFNNHKGIWYKVKNEKIFQQIISGGKKRKITNKRILVKQIYNKFFTDSWILEVHKKYGVPHYDILKNNYFGGFVHINDKHMKHINLKQNDYKIYSFDFNSYYPSIMNSDFLCPFGEPLKKDKIKPNKIYYKQYYITAKKDLKTQHIPLFFKVENSLRSWIQNLKKGEKFFIDSNNYELVNKVYGLQNFKIELLYTYNCKPFKWFFGDYVNHFYGLRKQAKKDKDNLMKEITKLFLNCLYGKFGSMIEKESLFYDFNNNETIAFSSEIRGYYLPVAMSITNACRTYLQEKVGYNYNLNFVYADTDSIKIIAKNKKEALNIIKDNYKIEVDEFNLLAGKFEFEGTRWIFRRAKQYFILNDNNKTSQIANNSVNWKNEIVNWDKFDNYKNNDNLIYDFFTSKYNLKKLLLGCDLEYQQDSVNIKGYGVSIDFVKASIKPVWEYQPYLEQKIINKKNYLTFLK